MTDRVKGLDKAAVPPRPPPVDEQELGKYQPFASADLDEFVRNVMTQYPDLAALIAAKDEHLRAELLARSSRQSRQASYGALISLAFQYGKRSRYAEALRFGRIRVEVAQSDTEYPLESFLGRTRARNVADALNNVGAIQEDMGDHSLALATCLEAEKWFQQDEALRQQAGITKPSEFDRIFHMEDIRSANLAQIANIYQGLGDEKAYAEYNAKAWQHSQRRADLAGRYDMLISAAGAAKQREDQDTALGAYWEALDVALELRSSLTTGKDVVEALTGAGRVYQELGLNRRALELFRRALEINRRGGHLGRQLLDHTHIAEVCTARGDVDAALEAYREALRCCSVALAEDTDAAMALVWQDGAQLRQVVRLESAWRILLAMTRLVRGTARDAALDNIVLAVRILESLRVQVVEEERRLSYQATAVDVYDEIIDLHAEMYEQTGNKEHLEELFSYIERAKARVLSEMLADQPIGKPSRAPDKLIEREAELLAEIDRLQRSLEGDGLSVEMVQALEHTRAKVENVWTAIVASDPDEGPEYVSLRRAEPASAADVRALLVSADGGKVAFVSYYVAPKRMISLCVFSDRADLSYHSEPADRGELRQWALVRPEDPPSIELRLPYWMLDFPALTVAPISPVVKGYDVVCLAPHDVLHSLPLHAFATSGESPLIAASTVCYIPSGSLLRFCLRKRSANAGHSLVMGNPDRPDWPAIPHSEGEVTAVAELLGTKALIRADATRSGIMEGCGAAEYIHLACHCKFSRDDPLDSALILTDGDLTARDILNLRMNPDLCVLSACESGTSKLQAGDELIGLVRALLFAGASAMVVSLWNAYDARTSKIMQDLYAERMRHRGSKAEALAEALRAQIRTGTPAAQWAPFILVGDWR